MGFLKSWLLVVFACCLFGCGPYGGGDPDAPDARDRGVIHVSADESFKPVLDAQVHVYEASYPNAKIMVHYKPEAECIKDLLTDSVRMIITTRSFTEKELQYVTDSFKLVPKQSAIALDAIAVIINPAASDSFFTMPEIKNLVSGKSSNQNLVPVFDGLRATSTVRFMLDSLLKGTPLGSNVTAAQNSEGVLDYVAQHKNAVGFIGVSWIGNKEDSAQQSFLKKVKIANIQSTDNPDGYIKPYQANIYARRYPMVRHLVYVLKEKHQGLGNGFANFMNGDRGQLIFRRAYLLPAKMPFYVRPTTLNQ
ncbi:MAG TPA: substrate-binding domain-containing protein [Chitinophagaceae bacterium]|nr:substrate-binding domain-containing protein [Chitinophagaceae bacterium]